MSFFEFKDVQYSKLRPHLLGPTVDHKMISLSLTTFPYSWQRVNSNHHDRMLFKDWQNINFPCSSHSWGSAPTQALAQDTATSDGGEAVTPSFRPSCSSQNVFTFFNCFPSSYDIHHWGQRARGRALGSSDPRALVERILVERPSSNVERSAEFSVPHKKNPTLLDGRSTSARGSLDPSARPLARWPQWCRVNSNYHDRMLFKGWQNISSPCSEFF